MTNHTDTSRSFLGDHRFWEVGPAGMLVPIADPLGELVLDIEGDDDPRSYRAEVLSAAGYDTMAPEFFGALDPLDPDDEGESDEDERAGVQLDVYAAAEGASEQTETPIGRYPFVVRMLFCDQLFWVYAGDFAACLRALGTLLPIAQASLARQQAEQHSAMRAFASSHAGTLYGYISQAVREVHARELEEALQLARSPEDRIQVLASFGQVDAAEQEADALEAGLEAEDRTPLRLARIAQARGHIEMYRHDARSAAVAYSEARRLLESVSGAERDAELEIVILQQLAHALLLSNQLDAAERTLEQAIGRSKTWRDRSASRLRIELLAWSIHLRGDLLIARFQEQRERPLLDAAEAAYREALVLLDEARAGKRHITRMYCERGLELVAELRAGGGQGRSYFQPKTA